MAEDYGNLNNEGKNFISSWPPEESSEMVSTNAPCKRSQYDNNTETTKFRNMDCDGFVKRQAKNNQDIEDRTIQRSGELARTLKQVKQGREEHMPCALTALAKWWKTQRASLNDKLVGELPDSSNPNTILQQVLRLPEAKQFMMAQVKSLQKQVPINQGCVGIHMALASYYSKMRDLDKAEEYIDNAYKLDPENTEIIWLQAKVRRDKELQDQTQKRKEELVPPKLEKMEMKNPIKVERRHHSSLDAKEFLFDYALTGTPLIITGLVEHMTEELWTIQYIKNVVGNKNVPLKKRVKQSTEWAKLEHCSTMTIESFINTLHDDKKQKCLFDWSLSTFAPELAKQITIPRYFAADFLQRTESCTMYRDSWPSLFLAPAGMISDLHVDSFGSNFWMALFEGRKRWTLFKKEALPCLYPHCDQDLNIVFDVDLSKPDLKDFPLLSTITPYQCILEPGELLFVPHGSPHYVETLEDSLAMSANYIDLSNYKNALKELKLMSITDPEAKNLHCQMENDIFFTKMLSTQKDLKWEQYKEWPRENTEEYDISLHDCQTTLN